MSSSSALLRDRTTLSQLRLTHFTSTFVTHGNGVESSLEFARTCWHNSVYVLGQIGKLNDLLHLAKREPRIHAYGFDEAAFGKLIADLNYTARTLAFASTHMELAHATTQANGGESQIFSKSARAFFWEVHQTNTGRVYRKFRSIIFSKVSPASRHPPSNPRSLTLQNERSLYLRRTPSSAKRFFPQAACS